jgi:hypothetical protein
MGILELGSLELGSLELGSLAVRLNGVSDLGFSKIDRSLLEELY